MWVYDASTLQDFMRCARYAYWRYERALAPATTSVATSFGAALHAAMRSYHELWDVERAVEVFRQHWETPEGETLRTVERGEECVRAYVSHYGGREPFKFIANERTFKVELPSGRVYEGRFDGVIEWDGHFYVYDLKHTTRMGPGWFRQWRPNLQMTGYVWAARQLFGVPVTGVLIDAIRIGPRTFEFARDISSREDWELEQFVKIVERLIDTIEMLRAGATEATTKRLFMPNWTACNDFGGCPYRELCLSPHPADERLVDVMYVHHEWSPNNPVAEEVTEA